jgi:hypothetical protein
MIRRQQQPITKKNVLKTRFPQSVENRLKTITSARRSYGLLTLESSIFVAFHKMKIL